MYKEANTKKIRKEKIKDEKFKIIMEMLKVDNTLSALDIQKKLL